MCPSKNFLNIRCKRSKDKTQPSEKLNDWTDTKSRSYTINQAEGKTVPVALRPYGWKERLQAVKGPQKREKDRKGTLRIIEHLILRIPPFNL